MRLIDADVLKQHIDKLPALPDGNFAGNHSALKALINMQPTIEPSTNCSEFPNNSTLQPICNQLATDCISRQAAIDVLECHYIERINLNDWQSGWNAAIDWMKYVYLDELPSAQPEIVRCKDCKYGDTFHEFDEPDMPMKCLGQHYGGTYPDDFCSYAERRTDERSD